MEYNGVHVLMVFAAVIFLVGAAPYLLEVYYDHKPSKWVPQTQAWAAYPGMSYLEVEKQDEVEDFINYATQQPIQPVTPLATSDIPVFSADDIPAEPLHSIPDEETLKNVDLLVESTMDPSEEEDYSQFFQFNDELVNFERPNVMIEGEIVVDSPLSDQEFQAIEKKYGTDVANMITATPNSTFTNGFVTMIGKIVFKGRDTFLQYRDQFIKMVGDVPTYEGETVLVSGHFVDTHTFTVMGWDDPEMIQFGYSSEENLDMAVV